MSNVAIYGSTNPNPILQYLTSANTPDYSGRQDVLINPDLTQVNGWDIKYWKHVAGQIQLMTQAERDAVDAALLASAISLARSDGKSFILGTGGNQVILRAIAEVVKDEINIARQWCMALKTQVALSISLADFKVRVATLSDLPDRTIAQVKTALNSKIDNGDVDA